MTMALETLLPGHPSIHEWPQRFLIDYKNDRDVATGRSICLYGLGSGKGRNALFWPSTLFIRLFRKICG